MSLNKSSDLFLRQFSQKWDLNEQNKSQLNQIQLGTKETENNIRKKKQQTTNWHQKACDVAKEPHSKQTYADNAQQDADINPEPHRVWHEPAMQGIQQPRCSLGRTQEQPRGWASCWACVQLCCSGADHRMGDTSCLPCSTAAAALLEGDWCSMQLLRASEKPSEAPSQFNRSKTSLIHGALKTRTNTYHAPQFYRLFPGQKIREY